MAQALPRAQTSAKPFNRKKLTVSMLTMWAEEVKLMVVLVLAVHVAEFLDLAVRFHIRPKNIWGDLGTSAYRDRWATDWWIILVLNSTF